MEFKINVSLKELRQIRGITLKELGARCGVSSQTVLNWETGKVEPSLSKVRVLAKALGLTVDDILF